VSRRSLAGLIAMAAAFATVGAAPAGAAGPELQVDVDRTHVRTDLGTTVSVRTVTRNAGDLAAADTILHLNILSLERGTYVDPEDWSSDRTRYVGSVAPGGSVDTTWRVQAVTSGRFALYVTAVQAGELTTGPVTGPGRPGAGVGRRAPPPEAGLAVPLRMRRAGAAAPGAPSDRTGPGRDAAGPASRTAGTA
jgi:hypothetical protein